MSCFVEWMTCKWNIENDITMYATAIDKWYLNMFYIKQLHYNSKYQNILSVDFSYCWFNLVEVWYSLEQYIGLKEDKLSSTTVDFIRSEGNLETKCLYWFSKPKPI